MKHATKLFLCILLFTYCASTGTREFTQFGESRIINSGYIKVFQATTDYLIEGGYKFTKTDMKTGEIETDYKLGVGWGSTRASGEKRAKIRAKVIQVDENQTRLVLEIFSEARQPPSVWHEAPMDASETVLAKRMYNRFFEFISRNVQ
ncbi:MAG: hypothetical protein ABIL68_11260 [bacterium]